MTTPYTNALSKDWLGSLTDQQRQTFLKSLNYEEAEWIMAYWPLWARLDQLPPRSSLRDWTSWIILGGRGAGKTRAGAEWIHAAASDSAAAGSSGDSPTSSLRIALIGETYLAARAVMVEGESGLLNIGHEDQRPVFQSSRRQLRWPSGALAELFSAEDPEALRGPQFHLAWCDELCKWRYADETWNMLQFALRLGERPQQVITTTPRAMPLLKKLMASPDNVITRATTYDNRNNLAPPFFDSIIRGYEGTRLGRQELNAEMMEDDPDSLWTRQMIDRSRCEQPPQNLTRIVIAVDPPITGTKKSAECGIIAAGLGESEKGGPSNAPKHAYVLADHSACDLSPTQWASRAVQAFRMHKADRIVAEVNQGGDMVETVIRQIAPQIPFRAVRASRGKRLRAEPVAALYEQNRIHHVGALTQLEDQMCSFTGGAHEQSPDRLDALVWAITNLMLSGASALARLRRI